jgi:TPR repeat protein
MSDKGFGGLLICLLLLSMPAFALEPEVQAAKDEGMRLYNIGESTRALPYLEEAAEAGDVEAMYYMGEAERRQKMGGMTLKAMNWYLQAAEQGDPYAMLRLFQGGACVAGDECPEDAEGWREKALAETLPKAEAGDTDAMLALNYVYRALGQDGEAEDWLEKSAKQGNPLAQTRLGKYILDGQGWYFLESRRLEAAEGWLRKAAEQGYVPGMIALTSALDDLDKNQELWEWTLEASKRGSRIARVVFGECLVNPEREAYCQAEKDVVRGWAILQAVVEEVDDRTARHIMESNRDRLTPGQLRQAEVMVDEWLNKQPPLSNFPPRFGF